MAPEAKCALGRQERRPERRCEATSGALRCVPGGWVQVRVIHLEAVTDADAFGVVQQARGDQPPPASSPMVRCQTVSPDSLWTPPQKGISIPPGSTTIPGN